MTYNSWLASWSFEGFYWPKDRRKPCTKSLNPIFRCATLSTGQIKGEVVVGTLYGVIRCSTPKYGIQTISMSSLSRFLVNKILGTVDNYKLTKPQRRSFHPEFSSVDFEQWFFETSLKGLVQLGSSLPKCKNTQTLNVHTAAVTIILRKVIPNRVSLAWTTVCIWPKIQNKNPSRQYWLQGTFTRSFTSQRSPVLSRCLTLSCRLWGQSSAPAWWVGWTRWSSIHLKPRKIPQRWF